MQEVHDFWHHHLDQIQVSTPSQDTDILLNGWLLYQSLACRMWARTAFYQAGGAYGFRDQLQDSLGLLHTLPELTRKQIMLHASHQYVEGDVQHWWHEETERGIRTLFSDDLLWLPYAVSDTSSIPTTELFWMKSRHFFTASRWVRMNMNVMKRPSFRLKKERFMSTAYARWISLVPHSASMACRYIGVGDWNDGMNLVGAEGRGESVWLGWFLVDMLQRFAELCKNAVI